MKCVGRQILWITILFALATAFIMVGCANKSSEAVKYQCPMHPTYISDRPGNCPICGMRLVPIETKTATPPQALYQCPMHPEITSDKPGNCPKCGMALVPIRNNSPAPEKDRMRETAASPTTGSQATAQKSSTEHKILFYRNPMNPKITSPGPAKDEMGMDYIPVYSDEKTQPAGPVEGLALVTISEQGMRLAGIQTAAASKERISYIIRTVGVVTADETRIRHIHTKVAGWIEKLYVSFTGESVRKGEPILSIYSPELLSSQEEYLRAKETADNFLKTANPEVKKGAEDLVQAARRRLELFDVPPNFIKGLDGKGASQRAVTLMAPISGFVMSKQTYEGQQVEPGMELFTITDLSRVWIESQFYEYEAKAVHLGQQASFIFPYDPSKVITGRVAYIYPYLNQESRTLKARFEFDNRNLSIKPGMYVNANLNVESDEGVVVQDSAVIDSGLRQVVFVDKGGGGFEPREVRVGIRSSGKAQILSGLSDGEKVAIHGNFLLDSESRLRSAISGMTEADQPQHAGETK